jgi:GTP-binding protein LepA
MALDHNLEIIPVINKIDLPAADPEKVAQEIETSIGIDASDALLVSAKSGVGIRELLDAIVDRVPEPEGDPDATTKAIIYDSWFDAYLGALALVRVFDGSIKKGQLVKLMSNDEEHHVLDLMYPHPLKRQKTEAIQSGEIGIVVLGLKDAHIIHVGDTITDAKNPTKEPALKYEPAKPFVFAGLYPIDTDKFEDLREALDKLKLNDSSLSYEPETSVALGFGFRVGFLGMLHMEVVKERLEREFNVDLIATAPSVVYHVYMTNGEMIEVQNPSELPEPNYIEHIEEPYVKATVITPTDYLGNIITLLMTKRGMQDKMSYLNEERVLLEYYLPMNEIVVDFYDKLKSISKGYASFDYEPSDFKEGDLVKLDVRVAGDVVDALSVIVPRTSADSRGRVLVKNMKELIPRQLFEVAVQASIGNRVIARETVKSMGKNVTAKCYGGDITRKRKLLEKQKAGKKRMKSIGKVQLPQEAFMSILKMD